MSQTTNLQRTYAMLKPDAWKRNLMGEIISRIEKKGFSIKAMKMFYFTKELLKEHYAHLVNKPFYHEIEDFMLSGPVIGMVLEGENIVEGLRKLMGSTKWLDADIGTIRGDYSCKEGENLIHGSDSIESAKIEIERFFGKNFEIR